MNPLLKPLLDRPLAAKVTLRHENVYGHYLVGCSIKPAFHRSVAVQSLERSEDEAIESAAKLLALVQRIEKENGQRIEPPPDEAQQHDGGYAHVDFVNGWKVSFRREGRHFEIRDVYQQDEFGFYILRDDQPLYHELKPYRWTLEDREEDVPPHRLAEGETLWYWNDLGPLCGSTGFVIKDATGKPVRMLGTLRA